MTTSGMKAETALFSILKSYLFVQQDPVLDQNKIDGIVAGIKFYILPHLDLPIAVQVTTRLGDWDKRVRFFEAIQNAAIEQTAFIELDTQKDISSKIALRVLTVLLSLFFDKNAPTHALISVDNSYYETNDLEDEVGRYKRWLQTTIKGKQRGVLTFWRWLENEDDTEETSGESEEDNTMPPLEIVKKRGYGFIRLFDPDVSAPSTLGSGGLNFYVSNQNISDELLILLEGKDGNVIKDKIGVSFSDGGAKKGHLRKVAVDVVPYSKK